MKSTKSQRVAQAFLAVAVTALFAIGIAKGITERAKDYHVYDRAGDRWLAGEALYRNDDVPMPYKYPPPSAALLVPFSVLPRALGGALLNGLSVLALVWVLRRLTSDVRLAAIAVACTCQSLFLVLDHGQVDLLILALSVWAWSSARPSAGGIAFALACLLKPPAGVFLFGWLRDRRFQLIAWSIAAGFGSLAFTMGRYGFHRTWTLLVEWRSLLGSTTGQWFLRHDAQGWPSAFLTPVYRGEVPDSGAVLAA
ncbi:MAG: glycosyltransferase family 87 protein, partial [Myxococcota bacterium]